MKIALLLLFFVPQDSNDEVEKLVKDLVDENWGKVRVAEMKLESLQEKAIPALIKLLDRDERVNLKNTADLIYPGAKEFHGHGFIVPYDLDWLCVRAGWALEELTFRRFGFREGALKEDVLMQAVIRGKRDVPLDEVVKLEKDPEVRKRIRNEAVKRAKAWWAKAKAGWKRIDELEAALKSKSANRHLFTLSWIRHGESKCDGLDRDSYTKRLLPLVKKLAESKDKGVRRQVELLLKDKEFYWLTIKGRK